MARLTIGKFAAAEGVSVETVRFYQRRGLLSLPERHGSGYREYTDDDRWRLAFIRRARLLGFTLGEITELLGPVEPKGAVPSGLRSDSDEGRRRLKAPGGERGSQHGPAQARSTEEIQRAAEAKLTEVGRQLAELAELACRLRRLVQVCAHGDSDDCVTLRIHQPGEAVPANTEER